MNQENMEKILTIIIPVYNWETTLDLVFKWLDKQNNKLFIDKIIIINDCSTDKSLNLIEKYSKTSKYNIEIINNKKSLGLSWNYNLWISLVKSKYFLLMHQDIVIIENIVFKKLTNQMNDTIFCLYPIILHPLNIYNEYSFWQKAMFSRFIWKRIKNLTWKFDIFNTKIFKEKIKNFDNELYRTAWEDSDLKIKIKKLWLKALCWEIEVDHIHCLELNFSIKKWIKKESQLSEAEGVLLRKYYLFKIKDLKSFIIVYFRQWIAFLLIISLFINNKFLYLILLLLIIFYSYIYTKKTYYEKWNVVNKILLPFVNIYILFISLFYTIKWFISWKQKI